MVAVAQRELASIKVCSPANVILFCGSATLPPETKTAVERLLNCGCRITAVVPCTSELTNFLSSKAIYYYVDPYFAGRFFERSFLASVHCIYNRLDPLNLDAVVQSGLQEEQSLALQLACWMRGLDACFDTQAGGLVTAGIKQTLRAPSSHTHIDAEVIRSTGYTSRSGLRYASGILLSLAVAWRYAKCSQKLYVRLKSAFERVLAASMTVICAPLTLAIAAKRTSSGLPGVDKVIVQGKDNKPVEINIFAGKNFQTAGGRFWWLPVLPAIATGKVSFVGPRLLPVDRADSSFYFWMKPGITGWSQVRGAGQPESEQVSMDNLYIATAGLLLDLKIVLLAVKQGVLGR